MRVGMRTLDRSDIAEVVRLGRELHEESRYRDIPFSEAAVIANLSGLIGQSNFYGKIVVLGEKIIGLMAGATTPMYFSEKKAASDLLFFVPKDSRGSMAGVLLIRDFTRWAFDDPDVVEVQLGVTTGIDVDKTGQLLRKLGFVCSGHLYTMGGNA